MMKMKNILLTFFISLVVNMVFAMGSIRSLPYQDIISLKMKVGETLELEFEEMISIRVFSDYNLNPASGNKDVEVGINKNHIFLRLNTNRDGELTFFGEESEDGTEQNRYRIFVTATTENAFDSKVKIKSPRIIVSDSSEFSNNGSFYGGIKEQVKVLKQLLKPNSSGLTNILESIKKDEYTGKRMDVKKDAIAKGYFKLGSVYSFPNFSVRMAEYISEADVTTAVPVHAINYRNQTMIHSSPWTVNPGETAEIKIFYKKDM